MLRNHFARAFAIAALATAAIGAIGDANAAYNIKPPNPRTCTAATIGVLVTTSYVAPPYTFYETYRCMAPFTWEWVGWKRCYTSTGQCQVLQLP